MGFSHEALNNVEDMPLVYTAMSKHLFYYRMNISRFVLEKGFVPLNPFMIFDYFLGDAVDRNSIRQGNNNIVMKADETWVFGPVSNGVLAEIQIAKKAGKPIKFFKIEKPHKLIEIGKEEAEMETDIEEYKNLL